MEKAKIIYEDRPTVYAKFDHPQSDDYIEYSSILQIKDSGKQPISIQLKFTGILPFSLMPPEEHIIKASDVIELYVKLGRWLGKFGYKIR